MNSHFFTTYENKSTLSIVSPLDLPILNQFCLNGQAPYPDQIETSLKVFWSPEHAIPRREASTNWYALGQHYIIEAGFFTTLLNGWVWSRRSIVGKSI